LALEQQQRRRRVAARALVAVAVVGFNFAAV